MTGASRADSSTPATWRKPAALAFLGGGAASLAIGSIAGVRAILDGRAMRRACPSLQCSSDGAHADATALRERGRSEAVVADVALPLGVLALGLGLYLSWSEPTTKPKAGTAWTPRLQLAKGRAAASLEVEVSTVW